MQAVHGIFRAGDYVFVLQHCSPAVYVGGVFKRLAGPENPVPDLVLSKRGLHDLCVVFVWRSNTFQVRKNRFMQPIKLLNMLTIFGLRKTSKESANDFQPDYDPVLDSWRVKCSVYYAIKLSVDDGETDKL